MDIFSKELSVSLDEIVTPRVKFQKIADASCVRVVWDHHQVCSFSQSLLCRTWFIYDSLNHNLLNPNFRSKRWNTSSRALNTLSGLCYDVCESIELAQSRFWGLLKLCKKLCKALSSSSPSFHRRLSPGWGHSLILCFSWSKFGPESSHAKRKDSHFLDRGTHSCCTSFNWICRLHFKRTFKKKGPIKLWRWLRCSYTSMLWQTGKKDERGMKW